MQSTRTLPKVAVVGAGSVGATCAYTLMLSSLAGEVAIANRTVEKARGEALDISHGMPLLNTTDITYGGYEVCEGAAVVVVTLGAAQEPGETRLELTRRNAKIFRDVIPRIAEAAPEAVLLIVSNPVDVLTYLSVGLSGFPAGRVMGSGTVLDTARLRYEMRVLEVDCRDIEAYVLGEHGDSEVIPASIITVGGRSFASIKEELYQSGLATEKDIEEVKAGVRNAAYEIIRCKGSTYYAIAVCVTRIVEAILLDQRSVLTVSSLLEGEFGIEDVCLSLPCIVGGSGVLERICPSLDEKETEELRASAAELRKAIEMLE